MTGSGNGVTVSGVRVECALVAQRHGYVDIETFVYFVCSHLWRKDDAHSKNVVILWFPVVHKFNVILPEYYLDFVGISN